jgi:hypothetical protein
MTDSDANPVFNEFHRKLFDISESHINRHTIALMSPRKGIIRPLGSGVFFHDQEMYFIFTAAHVVKDYPELLVQGPAGVINLSIPDAYIYYHPDSKLDVAFILLSNNLGAFLSLQYNPVGKEGFLLNHQPQRVNRYALVGFPGARVRHKGDRLKLACNTFLLQSSSDRVYNYYDRSKSDYYLLNMHGKTLNNHGNPYKAKSPRGMSGCGLWLTSYEIIEEQMKLSYFLIGIFTEKINGKYLTLSATNISHVFKGIEECSRRALQARFGQANS